MGAASPLLFTYGQAAERLQMSDSWLKRQVQARRVPHTRLGRRVLFSERDLDAIVAARRVDPIVPRLRRVGGARS